MTSHLYSTASTTIYTLLLCFGLTLICASCHTQKALPENTDINKEVPKEIKYDYLIEGHYKMMKVDKLGFIYLVNNKNEILKYDQNGEFLFRYSINRLGAIQQLDVQNPQKIFVYYSDYATIQYLDNTLSEMNKIVLEELNLWNIQGAIATRANNIWIYDNAQIRLLRINEQGTIASSTNERADQLIPYQNTFRALSAHDNNIYVCGTEGLDVFDEFGVWSNHYPIAGTHIQIETDQIFYIKDSILRSYSTSVQFKTTEKEILSLEGEVISFHLTNNELWVLDAGGVRVKEF